LRKRARLGDAAFNAITSQSLDAESQAALDRLLDDQAASDDHTDEAPSTQRP
jgi:hypothetical protein